MTMTMTSRKTFAVLLEEAMARANLTSTALAAALAKRTGRPISRQLVSGWRRGESPSPALMGELVAVLRSSLTPLEVAPLLAAYARKTSALPAESVTWTAK